MAMFPQRFIVIRMTSTARYSCDCTTQRHMMYSERVKITSLKKTHWLPTRGVKSVTSETVLSDSSPLPMPPHDHGRGHPIDVHIGRFHATHRNGVPTTPRSQVVLQDYLKYDRGMASPLVSTPSLPAFLFNLRLVLTTRFTTHVPPLIRKHFHINLTATHFPLSDF